MLLTTSEVCQILRCTRNTVGKRVKSGEIKAQKYGRDLRYPAEQFYDRLGVDELVEHIQRTGMAGILLDKLKHQDASVTKQDLGMPTVDEEVEALL